jgi:hypothetical protein
MENSDKYVYVIYGITAGFAAYSIISTAWISYYSLSLKSHNTLLMMISRNILIANAIHVVSYVMNWVKWENNSPNLLYNYEIICRIQGFFMSFSSISQGLWIIFYIFIHLIIIVTGLAKKDVRKIKSYIFYTIGYILPIILCIFFFFNNSFGPNDIYCYFSRERKTETAVKQGQDITFLLRWIIIILIIVFATIYIYFISCKKESLKEHKFNKNLTWRLLSYPVIQLFGTLYPTLYRYFGLSKSYTNAYIIVLLGATQGILFPFCFFITSTGFFSACLTFAKDISAVDTLDSGNESETVSSNDLNFSITI